MIKNLTRIVLALGLLFQASHSYRVWAAFDDLGAGARAPGMADTFVGVADDVNAIWYNPAGLVQLDEAAISTQFGSLLRGQDDGSNISTSYVAYGHPLKKGRLGTIGAAYHNFKASNLITERTLMLSYGWKLKVEPFGWKGTWLAGVTLKQLHHQFETDRFAENALNDAGNATGNSDPLFREFGTSKDAYAVDLGGLYRFGRQNRFAAGLSIMNLNRPDVSLSGSGDNVPRIVKLGLSYRPKWGLLSTEIRHGERLASSTDKDISVGMERRIVIDGIGAFTLRGGYAKGSRDFKALTGGLSYQFAKAELDYAFNFPIGNLDDTQGSHRVGFSFRMGGKGKDFEIDRDDERLLLELDLLSTFIENSQAAHAMAKIATRDAKLNEFQRLLLLELLVRKYPVGNVGLVEIRKDLIKYRSKFRQEYLEWPTIKRSMSLGVRQTEKDNFELAIEHLANNNIPTTLRRTALLSQGSKRDKVVRSIMAVALVELAAMAYRQEKIDKAIDLVRQLLDIFAGNEIIMDAYRRLLRQRADIARQAKEQDPLFFEEDAAKIEVPEAPQVLVAPKKVVVSSDTAQQVEAKRRDALLRNFGNDLGNYFSRKANKASKDELVNLLKQMKLNYGDLGIDLSLIDKELAALEKAPVKPAREPAPVVETPVEPVEEVETVEEMERPELPAPVTTPVSTPAPKAAKRDIYPDDEFQASWNFYTDMVTRGLSDHERIEVLEDMLMKYENEGRVSKIAEELDRLKKRLR